MQGYMKCQLQVLAAQQKILWDELGETPPNFVLYGGTALALRYGHRVSVDFDFFSNKPLDPDELYNTIPYLKGGSVQQSGKNTLTCTLDRGGPVQVSFFGGLDLGCVLCPDRAADNGLWIASALDVGAAKARVIIARSARKDYQDLSMLIQRGQNLTTILSAAQSLYKAPFSVMLSLKAMSYFADLNPSLPKDDQERLMKAVHEVKIANIKMLKVHKEITPQPKQMIRR